MRRRLALMVALSVTLEAPRAAGEPYVPAPREILHLTTPSTARTDGGTDLRLPPGYFLDEEKYEIDETEMKRLQDAETRLRAENASLRKDAGGITFGWYALGTAVVLGLVGGFYTARAIQ